jgi:CubicO group peptidase (beta-lactamase class C family)
VALAIVHGDQITHEGFGTADPTGRLMTPQTPVMLASLAKPMTGLAIMQLAEAGKIDLDAPVQRYIPWFRVADEVASAQITVRHLLYHTSGLPEKAGTEYGFKGDDAPTRGTAGAAHHHWRAVGGVPYALNYWCNF